VIYSVVYSCQLFVFVIRIRYSLCIYSSVIIRYYSISYFICCSIILFHFHLSFVLIVVQKKKNNSEPELFSGILIP
jgi:hypothetical protein